MSTSGYRIGFVSTRLAGTDGVSLETVKWSNVLTGLGHQCFYFAGESDWPGQRSMVISEAHFSHPLIRQLNADLFDDYIRSAETSRVVQELTDHLKQHLYRFVGGFDIQLLIVENALSLPMNVPLGLALTQVIAETDLPTIAHHHDLVWERGRYSITAADDYLRAAFPPTLEGIAHVVINSFARRQLALRTGVSSTLIPNVMDFRSDPTDVDEYADDLRSALGLDQGDLVLLQPTRIVPRKRIERSIELARRLVRPCALVISHGAGDENGDYDGYLEEYSRLLGVKTVFAGSRIAPQRGIDAGGRKIYSLADVYRRADLVTYPSAVEGFGNAFLEAVYYRRPIVMSAYEIFKVDIEPKGFDVISFQDFPDGHTVARVKALLADPDRVAAMTEHNYHVGVRYYSYAGLERRLAPLIRECLGSY